MRDITVLYLSKVGIISGFGYRPHTHDYWHFTVNPNIRRKKLGEPVIYGSTLACHRPGELSSDYLCEDPLNISYNVMFLVHNKSLARKLEALPFEALTPEEQHIPVIEDIVQKIYDLQPGQEFVDNAFGYYLQLLLASYRARESEHSHSSNLVERALNYINGNHMKQIRLEDVAEHIGRTANYTSSLIKSATGMSVVEHVREARIQNACGMFAYSDIPLEEIISSCGFISASYFHKVFRERMGTTPNRYRTSHQVGVTFYQGEDHALDIPYDPGKQFFTYIPGAHKRIDWKTPRAYFAQEAK